MDARFDEYQTCNICVDGHDPMSVFGVDRDHTCSMLPIPEYICACSRGKVCDDTKIGRELVAPFFQRLRVSPTNFGMVTSQWLHHFTVTHSHRLHCANDLMGGVPLATKLDAVRRLVAL